MARREFGRNVMEKYGCLSEEELKELINSCGLKRRRISFYPRSFKRQVDDDRIIHCIPEKSERCPSSRPFLFKCEIESDPSRHPKEHLIVHDGYKRTGACEWIKENC